MPEERSGKEAPDDPPILALIDRLNGLAGRAASWLLLMMTAALAVIILMARFKAGFVWLQELVVYFHAVAFMTASAYTLLHDGHVRIDLVYSRLSLRKRALVNALGTVFLLLPTCGAILYYSIDYVLSSWRVLEGSPEASGLPATFILKSFIWIYVVLMSLQGISLLGKSLRLILGKAPAGDPVG